MAYISTEQVKSIRDQIKAAYPQYKWSISRRHSSTVVVILRESDLPYDGVHIQVNQYWLKETEKLNTKAKLLFQHVLEICNTVESCYDRNAGDVGADYGDSTYFIDLDIGQWDKPHKIAVKARGFSRAMTHQEIGAYRQECERNRATIQAPAPANIIRSWSIPHLRVSIVEEGIA